MIDREDHLYIEYDKVFYNEQIEVSTTDETGHLLGDTLLCVFNSKDESTNFDIDVINLYSSIKEETFTMNFNVYVIKDKVKNNLIP